MTHPARRRSESLSEASSRRKPRVTARDTARHRAFEDLGASLDMCGADLGERALQAWRALRDAQSTDQHDAALAAGLGCADAHDVILAAKGES